MSDRRTLSQLGLLLESKQQTTGGAVVVGAGALSLQLALDVLSECLAQLDTPLVERVDVPDGTLGESDVLVVGDQSTQSGGGDLLGQDRGGRAVAQEGLVSNKLLRGTLGLNLSGGLANHQGLRLGKEVGSQHALVLATLNGVVRLGGHQEISGDELSALVQKLEEAVLRIGGRLTEQDGTGGVLDVLTGASDSLAVALHGQLLQVGGEAVQILVKGSNQVGLSTKEVAVPNTQQTTKSGDVLLERCLSEVLVHSLGTSQELVEVVVTNVQSDRQANGTPDGVTTTNPRFKSKHVLGINAKLGDLSLVGRKGDEVLGNVFIFLSSLEEPSLGGVGIGGGLCGSEGLGGNQEKGGLRVRVLKCFGDMGAVNVRNEVKLHVGVTIRLESLGDHDRAAGYKCQQRFVYPQEQEGLTDRNHQYQC